METPDSAQSKGRVLVVDDNRDSRESLALALRTLGYVVQTVGDSESAVSVALSFEPQLAILDVIMPGASGFKTCERFRREEALRDIIIITATSWQADYDDFLSKNAGANYHLLKPLDLKKLEGILQTRLPF